MPGRKKPLITNKIYHVISRSIAEFIIFRDHKDYERMRELLQYYRVENTPLRYSVYKSIKKREILYEKVLQNKEKLVEIIAYCIMPTHIHLVLKQLKDNGISLYMGNILNSYSKYFNAKTKRKGPLWEGRFKSIEVETDDVLYHLTRYIHLNPVTAYLVEKPEDWKFSSYKEFISEVKEDKKLCSFKELMDINPEEYKKFVLSRKDYQRQLAKIKNLILEPINTPEV